MLLFIIIIVYQFFYTTTAPFLFFSSFKHDSSSDRDGDVIRYRDTIVFGLLHTIITGAMLYFLVYYGQNKTGSDSSQDSQESEEEDNKE
jgi:hypothetical protein